MSIRHALVLNLHQPPWNLEHLLEHYPWEAKEILFALDRIPRSLWGQEDLARVHLSLSGTLLETLASPEFQEKAYGIVDCGALLWHLQNDSVIDILGTGYYHPVFALIPPDDWPEQLLRWQNQARHLFWRERFNGFWPPEMGFRMELIPLLKKMRYRYVLVDSEHVRPVTPMSWQELRYRPHIARHGDAEIIVIVRDRDLSDAQEAGMEYGWFRNEVGHRIMDCGFEPLVTTATDGDNGGWFRNTTAGANFWSSFYAELLDQARQGSDLLPTFIDDYLDQYGVHGEVTVETGAWNTGWHHGRDFTQWQGSQRQRDACDRIHATSHAIHEARWLAGEQAETNPEYWRQLDEAMWHLLRAETSCNLYWGEAWLDRLHTDLDTAWHHLNTAKDMQSH